MGNRYSQRRSLLPRPAVCRASPPPPDPSPFAIYCDVALIATAAEPADSPFYLVDRRLFTSYPAGPDVLAFNFEPAPNSPFAAARATAAWLPSLSPVIPNLTVSLRQGAWSYVRSYSIQAASLDPLLQPWVELPTPDLETGHLVFRAQQVAGMQYPQ